MNGDWPRVRLGSILKRREVYERRDELSEYTFAGTYSYARGVFRGATKRGSEFRLPELQRVRAGDFVYCKIMAWEGAFGVAPPETDNCVLSKAFLVYHVDESKVSADFLNLLFQMESTWSSIGGQSTGTNVRRRSLHPVQFERSTIPLPPLAEQRRIVNRVDAIASRLAEARRLKAESKGESDRIWKMLSRMARETAYPVRTLADMADFLDGRRVPLSEVERALRKGVYPYYGASGVIDHIDDFLFDEPLLLLSEDGANLINRSTPIAFIARGKYWVNNHAHVLKPKDGVADIDFLRYALSDFEVGVFNFASAQAKLNQKNAMRISFPLPPLAEQRRIVAHLDAVQAKADTLRRLQAEAAAELDALLPAVLAKAFAGEL